MISRDIYIAPCAESHMPLRAFPGITTESHMQQYLESHAAGNHRTGVFFIPLFSDVS
jgi:hypothetical protein